MFELERFVADCRAALRESTPEVAAREVVERAIIHSVTNPLRQFTGALHVYGGDFFAVPRSEWDPETLEEQPYDVEHARRVFHEANERWRAQAQATA